MRLDERQCVISSVCPCVKERVCAGVGGGGKAAGAGGMSTFLTLVRVCAQCLNVKLNKEPL